ncbi:hypothetical protein HDU82_002729 [Entophlyctis luteolus]|nr:hypothetical protein HDU82_002729 [Entophlyctis luteolus]
MAAPNPHAAALADAFSYLKQLEAASDYTPSSGSPSISTKPSPIPDRTAAPVGRAHATIKAATTIHAILAALRNIDRRGEWDDKHEGIEILQRYDDSKHEVLVHSLRAGQWPVVSKRDFVAISSNIVESDSKAYVVLASVDDSSLAEVKGRVRASIYSMGWIISKDTSQDDAWDLTVYAHVDPNGGLPSAIVQKAVIEGASVVFKFATFFEANFAAEE